MQKVLYSILILSAVVLSLSNPLYAQPDIVQKPAELSPPASIDGYISRYLSRYLFDYPYLADTNGNDIGIGLGLGREYLPPLKNSLAQATLDTPNKETPTLADTISDTNENLAEQDLEKTPEKDPEDPQSHSPTTLDTPDNALASEDTQTTTSKKKKPPRHVIILAPGLFFGDTRDLVVSSLYRFAVGGGGRFHYEYIHPFQYHFVSLEGHYGQLLVNYQQNGTFTALGKIEGDLDILLNIAYSSAFNVFSLGFIDLYLGFTIEANLDFWIVESFLSYGWNGSLTVGPSLMLMLDLNDHVLRFNYYLPILGSLSRPLYNFYNFELERRLEASPNMLALAIDILTATTHLFSWKDAFRTTLAANYEWQFSPHVGLFTRYAITLEYYRTPVSRSKTNLLHQLYFGLAFYW